MHDSKCCTRYFPLQCQLLPFDGKFIRRPRWLEVDGFKMPVGAQANFKTMDFLSTTFWHFISDKKDDKGNVEWHSLDILLEKVLKDGGSGKLLKDPGETKFHARKIFLERSGADVSAASRPNDDSPPDAKGIPIKEPKAVCFADIPFNFLPIHIRAYNGIGLGFDKDALLAHAKFRPVTYYPRVIEENLKDACEAYLETPEILKPYAKVQSEAESFDNIYREREWRIPEDVVFNFSDLSCIVFRTDAELLTAIGDAKIQKLMKYGVSMLSCERHFERVVDSR